MPFPYEALLFALALIIAALIIRTRSLFACVMLSGIFSLLCTGIYTLADAVDVAFTEAAVGTGISTVLFLAVLSLTGEKDVSAQVPRHWSALFVSLLAGGALLYGIADMPRYGDPAAPIHHHLVPRYLVDSMAEVGMPNFVTSILASYRGYDTFGETTVVFTAAVGVLLILGGASQRKKRNDAPKDPGERGAPVAEEDSPA